jgi:hypothetical protein
MNPRYSSVIPGSLTALLVGVLAFTGCADDVTSSPDDGSGGTVSPDPDASPGTSSGNDGGGTVPGKDSGGTAPGKDGGVPTKDGATPGDGSVVSGFGTIFTIVMENHDYNEIVGSADAPYFNSLIADYGLATNYLDSGTHPSLPNYLTMISGAPQYGGIFDIEPTGSFITGTFPVDQPNLGTQLQTASVPWRAYAENMGTACTLTSASPYATKHDPFLYFTDMQTATPGLCAKTNVDYGSFAADLAGGTYKYMWITPNLTNDGHDPVNGLGTATDPVGSLKASDAWAKTEIGKIMATPAYTNGGVIFLTWDEGEGRNGNSKDQVPMIIISTKIVSKGFKSATAYTHKSYLATVEDMLKLPRLATVTSEASMMEFFK